MTLSSDQSAAAARVRERVPAHDPATPAPTQAPDAGSAAPRGKAFRTLFVAVVLFALVVRVGYVLATPGFVPKHDAHHYDLDALYIARTHHYPPVPSPHGPAPNAYRPPAYAYSLAAIYKLNSALSFLGISRWEAVRLVESLLGAIAVGLLALIAFRIWGRRTAILAGVLAAVFPPIIYVGTSMYSEALFVPLVVAATAAVVEYRHRRRLRTLVIAGVLTGLAALTRENGMTLLLPFAIGVWGPSPRRSWQAFKPAAVLLVCTVVVVVPWTIRNAVVLHAFVPVSTSAGNTLAGTYNDISRNSKKSPAAWHEPSKMREFRSIYRRSQHQPQLNQAQLDIKLRSRVASYIVDHPTYPLVVGYWNTVRLLELEGMARSRLTGRIIGVSGGETEVGVYALWLVALLALVGCFTSMVRRGPRWLWLVPAIMYFSIVFIQSETPRFRSPVDPFLALLAALAISAAWDRLSPVSSRSNRRVTDSAEPALASDA